MSRFDIIRSDPLEFKSQIIELWNEYLPGTPPGRFDWMSQGNPAGEAGWYFAFDNKNGDLAGVMSVMPKTMYLNGKSVLVGILGDFIVKKKYQVFGPGLILPKYVIEDSLASGFDCILTIPNSDSRKIVEKAGLKDIKIMRHFFKPTTLEPYIEQHIPTLLAGLMAPIGDFMLRILTRENYGRKKFFVIEEQDIDSSFDIFWETVRESQSSFIGGRSTTFLRWKYLQNPIGNYRLITLRDKPGSNVQGYIFFRIEDKKMDICDMLAIDKQRYLALIRKAAQISRVAGCNGMYLRVNADNQMIPLLSKCFFLDAHDDILIQSRFKTETLCSGCWYFLSGDRNI